MNIKEIFERENKKIIIDQVWYISSLLIISEKQMMCSEILQSYKNLLIYIPGVIDLVQYILAYDSEIEFVSRIENFLMILKLYCPEVLELYKITKMLDFVYKGGGYDVFYESYEQYRDVLHKKRELELKIKALTEEYKADSNIED